MTALEQIEKACKVRSDARGKAISLKLRPPATTEQIEALQQQVGVLPPEELRSILTFTSGIEGALDHIDFTGESSSLGMEEVFPHGLPFAGDGCGNFWVLDLTPDTRKVAPIFFACHDAPVILYQSADLATFLRDVFSATLQPDQSQFDAIHEDRLFNVWGRNPGVMEHAGALSSPDPVVRTFAEQLTSDFQVIDLRDVEPGMGFSWGRHGPRTVVRRHGHERIFAYAPPPKKLGLWSKLFGR